MLDCLDDSDLSGELAEHADHRDLDSARDSYLAHRAERDRTDDQHHDPWRICARGRHSRRRRDRGSREHQPQSRLTTRDPTGHPGQRGADRDSGFRIHAFHLHRLCADVLIVGRARYLFLPLAEAVVFAMLASYFLSRTIVPTMATYLLRGQRTGDHTATSRNFLVGLQQRFELSFESFRVAYRGILERCLYHRRAFLMAFFATCLGSLAIIVPWLGQDFFPAVDAGSFKLHLRAPTGMRIEDTAFLCDLVEDSIRKQIPAAEVDGIIDNIGLPYSGINLSYSNSGPIGTSDADILVTLSPKHHPTDNYVKQLRLYLAKNFPGVTFAFLPSDMVTQILNFGLPAPIDIQVIGNDLQGNRVWASNLLQKIRYVPGATDLRVQQPFDEPYLHMRVERTKAQGARVLCA